MKNTAYYQIHIQPHNTVIEARAGDNLYTLLLVNDLIGEGEDACRLDKGSISAAEDAAAEDAVFSSNERTDGWMLASQRSISGDAHIFLPPASSIWDDAPATAGESAQQGLGLVVDLGSGTIAAGLAELKGLVIPAVTARGNSHCQAFGDMGTRLKYIREQADGLAELQALLYQDIEHLTLRLAQKTGLQPADIKTVVIAANTALGQMLWGEEPSQLAMQEQPWQKLRRRCAADTPLLALMPQAELYLLPAAAIDVGSDIVAAILAAGLEQKVHHHNLSILLDVGLSSEIVVAGRGRLLATSVGTPALEGVSLACGMRATTGAITEVSIEDAILLNTVRDASPRGICGAGLISAAYELLRHGMLDADGRIVFHDQLPPRLAGHFSRTLSGGDVLLSRRANRPDIYIDQNDIRQLQLAKGSVYAAIQTLLREFAATQDDIEQLLISESFGTQINIEAALGIGLIPQIAPEKIKLIDNAAWQGAYLCLCNLQLIEQVEKLAAAVERLDLNINLTYAEQFLAAMNFAEME